MTTSAAFSNLAELVADLPRAMPRSQRFERLLDVFRRNFPATPLPCWSGRGDTCCPVPCRA